MFAAVTSRFAALSLVLVLGGCAIALAQPERLGLRLPPAALGQAISLQQHLRVQRDGRVDELDAALEVDSAGLDLVGLVLGQRVFALHYDGQTLKSWRHRMLPAQVRSEDVLEDIQLTLWPVEAIRQALPAGWHIREDGPERILSNGDTPVTIITYRGQSRWSGEVELSNLRYGYRLTIQSVSTPP